MRVHHVPPQQTSHRAPTVPHPSDLITDALAALHAWGAPRRPQAEVLLPLWSRFGELAPAQVEAILATFGRALGPDTLWESEPMRAALARRDITKVYRMLQRHGVSQHRIGAATGQCQSEVSDIVSGRRVVASYDVLVRIASGLGVPRGWLGLAYADGANA